LIEADDVFLKDLFGDKFLFDIPDFQRPFSWEEEHFAQLVDDIKDALDNGGLIEFPQQEPYFLGSVILWQRRKHDDGSGLYSVIDGQQRLTSLAILIACLRDLATESQAKKALQEAIYQEANEYSGTEACVRIQVRESDFDYFMDSILTPGGTIQLVERGIDGLSDSQSRMARAVSVFRSSFSTNGIVDQSLVGRFIKYLLQRVVVVVVKTSSLSSGFRLFNIINTRGLPLSNADLLKSENLRAVPEEKRAKHAKAWETIEDDLGTERFATLISLCRTILVKDRPRKAIFEEFEDLVFARNPKFKGAKFLGYLSRTAQIFSRRILDGVSETGDSGTDVWFHNLVSLMRDFLPFNDWMAPLILFGEKFPRDSDMAAFVNALESKVVVDWLRGLSLAERLTQIYHLIKVVDDGRTPDEVLCDSIFCLEDYRDQVEAALDDTGFYGRASGRLARYILLRLELTRSDNLHKRIAYRGTITIEHILPQTPTHEYWLSRFDERQRATWTNKLGNLTPLNGRKNSSAGNRPFREKVDTYFLRRNDFDLTNALRHLDDWDLDSLQARQAHLRHEALNAWFGTHAG